MTVPLLVLLAFATVCFLIAGPGWASYAELRKNASFRRPSDDSMRFQRFMLGVLGVILIAMAVVVVVVSVDPSAPA